MFPGVGCGPATADDAPVAGKIEATPSIRLTPCTDPRQVNGALCATHEVYEDRRAESGRTIPLNVVVLPALEKAADASPVFYLAGGPGAGATASAGRLARSWMRRRHDIVLVDQRGTGRSNPLGCAAPASNGLQGYLERSFGSPQHFARCRQSLARRADLTMYSTPIAMDDLDEVRRELGYERINLYGGSYGTRAALVYMRRHTDSVRAAILTGVAPMGFTNPLYHAREAQNALRATLAECAADTTCGGAFPDLQAKLSEVLDRLDAEPAHAMVAHPRTGARASIRLGREAFADGLRVFMYYMPRARRVPLLIHEAWRGNYDAVSQELLEANAGLASGLQMGMLLSVTCAEDVDRIAPADISAATEGTFLGDARVRQQVAACEVWPRSELAEDFGEPVSVDVPVLLFSGTLDPVTGPRWGEEAASHLPRSKHLVVPGAHGVNGPCIGDISRDFLESGTLDGLDTACVNEIRLPPFDLR
jgi:pimeloyl-ACP methyl ester carboxylesterase